MSVREVKDIFKISGGGGGWASGSWDGGGGVVPVSKKFFGPSGLTLVWATPGSPLDRNWFLVLNNFWVTQYNCPLLNDLFYLFIFKWSRIKSSLLQV